MSYQKQTWENGVSKLNAARLNHMEDGIEEANITAANAEASAGTANAELLNILKLAEAYDPADSYDEDDIVKYEGTFYRCIGATTGQWDSSKWTVLTLDWLVPRSTLIITANGGYNVKGYKRVLVKVFDPGTIQTVVEENIGLTSQSLPSTVLSKALLDYVGGMCQKVNQLVPNGNLATDSGWSSTFGSQTFANHVITYQVTTVGEDFQNRILREAVDGFDSVNGNKYLVMAVCKPLTRNYSFYARMYGSAISFDASLGSLNQGVKGTVSAIATATRTERCDIRLCFGSSGKAIGDEIEVYQVAIANLSVIYPTDTPTSTSDPRIQWLMSYLSSHPEYDAGSIITAPVTKVVSKGFNLWDEEFEAGYINNDGTIGVNDPAIHSKNYTSVIPNTTMYCYCGSSGVGVKHIFYDRDKNFVSLVWKANGTFSVPAEARYYKLTTDLQYGATYNHDICINVSNASMNGTYMPWRAPIEYPIPAEVQALEGYGLGLSADCNNHASYERKKYVQEMKKYTFTGDEVWTSSENAYYATVPVIADIIKKPSSSADVWVNQLNDADLEPSSPNRLWGGTDVSGIGLSTNGNIWISSADYTNKNKLIGKTIYFELATPIETDISEYLDRDFPDGNLIDVTAGGCLEFENENDLAVPYEVTYQYRVVEATSNDVGE